MSSNDLVRLSAAVLETCSVVPAESLLTAAPQERGALVHHGGTVTCGVWEATPYAERLDDYPVNEFAHVLSGKLAITPDDGLAQTFGPGEAYCMFKGFSGRFEVIETMRKS